uniref:Uncharacterized protein n=1 Tax=Setaria viridis TaxID=4556 RepID=A0A4U6V3G9_SETVI|nr:hypothetical protein SEVIR_4G225500v2 [Setaria viridis]
MKFSFCTALNSLVHMEQIYWQQLAARCDMEKRIGCLLVYEKFRLFFKEGRADWMKLFRDLLLAFVFFTLPTVLVFFPRFDQASKNDKETEKHAPLLVLLDNSVVGAEKLTVLIFFIIHATIGLLGVHIAHGPVVKSVVGWFTLVIIISVMCFVDYILLKTVPDNTTNKLLFLAHFIAMAVVTCGLWYKYVVMSCLCKDAIAITSKSWDTGHLFDTLAGHLPGVLQELPSLLDSLSFKLCHAS